jgi:ABC-type nickel/cobalt efflux system permease component RcnA
MRFPRAICGNNEATLAACPGWHFLLGVVFSLCVLCGEVRAHPIPKENHDRTIVVWLRRGGVTVDYQLDVDEGRAARDLTRADLAGVTSLTQFYDAYIRLQAPVLAGNLVARFDGKPLTFTCGPSKYEMPEMGHLACKFRFQASWTPATDRPVPFTFREANYYDDDFSRLELTMQPGAGVELSSVTAPDKSLWERPKLQREPGDSQRLRRLQADVRVSAEEPPGEARQTLPPESELPRSGPRRRKVAEARSAPTIAVAFAKPFSEVEPPPTRPPEAGSASLLHLLLDTRRGFALLLLAAAGLGAAHALTPGHGKTLVAAYLVGERGTVWHALVLGLVTTLTHTGAVLALATVGYFFPDAVSTTMVAVQLVAGLAITLLGCWLLMRRLAGQADHFHLPGQGHHHHGHHDHHVPDPKKIQGVGRWHLIVLGVQGGIVPCWDAILILSVAVSTGRLSRALPLLLAFSAGLAGVLVGLGISVVSARRLADARWGDHHRLHRLVRVLPILSALTIMGMGLWLCYDSIHAGDLPPNP